MKKILSTYILLSILVAFTSAFGQTGKAAIDYLKVAGPIVFGNQSYHLAWTAHPSTNFYKQEYVPRSESVTKFNTMILIDVLTGNQQINDIVAAKVAELKKMKETNPIVNYEALENSRKGEYMLDFLVSQNSPDGKSIMILERNVYRYKVFTDPSGKKGILLFGISTRSYGKDVEKFFAALKSGRNELINTVSKFNIPDISISN